MKTIINGLVLAVFCGMCAAEALARTDFYSLRDVSCDETRKCVFKENNQPFSGELRLYYPDGKIFTLAQYKDGVLDGKYISYHNNGKYRTDTLYKNGVENGVRVEYYDNGNKKSVTQYDNGQRDGKMLMYYREGELKQETPYKKDVVDGTVNAYYENGKPFLRVFYAGGEPGSGYCLTPKGQRLTVDVSVYASNGATPCDAMKKELAER